MTRKEKDDLISLLEKLMVESPCNGNSFKCDENCKYYTENESCLVCDLGDLVS